jgi:pimeloyl-ACP methyl ester carboxylesterase
MERLSTKVSFPGVNGDQLSARLERPKGTPKTFALFAHCFTCGKDIFSATMVTTALAEKKIAVLRFDFTGLGGSEGDFANTNFSSNIDDLVAAAEFLGGEYNPPQLLVGHSLGGSACLVAARKIPSVRCVATIAAPYSPMHLKESLSKLVPKIEREGKAEVTIGGQTFPITRQFIDDISQHNMDEHLRALDRALLIMHSPDDESVNISNAQRIFQNAQHPKSFISLSGADHLLSNKDDARYVGALIAAWAERYIRTSI